MKILHLNHLFYPGMFGGVARVVYNISRELTKRGHEVTVYTTNALDRERNFELKGREYVLHGFKVHYFKNVLRMDRLYISPSLISALRRDVKDFEVIHLHSWRQIHDPAACYYAKKYGVPYVLQAHGSLPRIMAKQRLKWGYDLFFGYRLLRDASKVIALSQMEAEQYRGMGVPKEKIAVIPNGIDLSEYADLPPRRAFKKKFNIDNNEKIVLYLGRIHEIKGIDILVKAFAKVIGKYDGVRLVVVGPDDGYLVELQALIKALKIEDKVLISGPLYGKDKLEAYVDADVYVLPSRYEIWGMTVLEAVACGTPIILSENCGIAEYFRDKVGLVVKPDSNHLSEALLEMLLNHKRRSIFRENCKAVIEKFDISKKVSVLEKFYEEIVRQPILSMRR